jgi:hypothetical protein
MSFSPSRKYPYPYLPSLCFIFWILSYLRCLALEHLVLCMDNSCHFDFSIWRLRDCTCERHQRLFLVYTRRDESEQLRYDLLCLYLEPIVRSLYGITKIETQYNASSHLPISSNWFCVHSSSQLVQVTSHLRSTTTIACLQLAFVQNTFVDITKPFSQLS